VNALPSWMDVISWCTCSLVLSVSKFASGGAGEQSVPTTRAYKECFSFRTSKVDYRDDFVLQLMATRSKPRFRLRGLLFNPTAQRFVSRDLNACSEQEIAMHS
jgi:hypothetical protein